MARAEHKSHETRNEAEGKAGIGTKLPGERESEESHVKLNVIASPDSHSEQQEPTLSWHLGHDRESVPQFLCPSAQLADKPGVTEEIQQAPRQGYAAHYRRPEKRVRDHIDQSASYRILHQKRVYGSGGDDKRKNRKQKHHQSVGQPVCHHRTQDGGKRSVLTSGNVSATPHLAETRKDEIERIAAEDRAAQSHKRRPYAKRAQLKTPAGRACDMGQDTDAHRRKDPPIVHPIADYPHHIREVDLLEHIPDEHDGQSQWEKIAHGIAQQTLGQGRTLDACLRRFIGRFIHKQLLECV